MHSLGVPEPCLDCSRTVCLPKVNVVKLFDGRAYYPVYANNLDPKYSCSWTNTGRRRAVLARLFWLGPSSPRLRVTCHDGKAARSPRTAAKAWLTVEYNPTTLKVGNNVHPAAFIDPTTGVIDNCLLLELGGDDARLSPGL